MDGEANKWIFLEASFIINGINYYSRLIVELFDADFYLLN